MAKPRRKESVKLLGVTRRKRGALMMSTALQATVVVVLAVPGLSQPAAAQPAPNARPTGARVIAGSANVSQQPHQTTIDQASNRAALSFKTYNVGSQQSVVYHQPSARSVTLNRVEGSNPSQIAGRIQANGRIVLMNQAGVTFYKGAQVNTNGLMVTAASMSDGAMKSFVNTGVMNFDRSADPNARVENRGNITIKQAGLAALVAPSVANSGTITAKLGHVVLAGARKTTVDMYGDGLVSLDVSGQVTKAPLGPDGKPVTALVTNTGVIRADGGTVQLTARQADGVVTTLVDAGGRISANSVAGRTGSIALNGVGGGIVVQGQLSAAGQVAGSKGGVIAVNTGGNVTVASTARIDASGQAGGGTVALGTTLARAKGGPGVTPTLTAAHVTVAKGASIHADATAKGDGGDVTALSTRTTTMDGDISAKGGPQGGNGGSVEVSGKTVGITGSIDVSAPQGATGSILLDPDYLNIVAQGSGGTEDGNFGTNTGTVAAGDGLTGAPDTLSNGVLNAFNGNVRLQANKTITVAGDISLTKAPNLDLTLDAGGSITVNAGIGVTASGNVTFATGDAAPGTITPQASPQISLLGSVTSTGGTVNLLSGTGGTISISAPVSAATTANLTSGSGGITLNGGGAVTATTVTLNGGTGTLALGSATIGKTGGTLDLASGAAVTQANTGTIAATTLQSSGSIAHNVDLAGTANAVGTIADFALGGNFTLKDSKALAVNGALSATSGNVLLQTSDPAGITVNGSIAARVVGGLASFQADKLAIASGTGTITGGTFEFAPNSGAITIGGSGNALASLAGVAPAPSGLARSPAPPRQPASPWAARSTPTGCRWNSMRTARSRKAASR